jgi:Ca2+-binding RTX toxin-like protein
MSVFTLANFTSSFTIVTPGPIGEVPPADGPGTPGPDTLTGTEFADVFDGTQGDDTLFGLAGNDLLIGGPGNDALWGGADSDQFLCFRLFDHDTIMDYATGDTIGLHGFNVDDVSRLAPFIDPTSETLRFVFTYGGAIEQLDIVTVARGDAATVTIFNAGSTVTDLSGTEVADTLFAAENRPQVIVQGLGGNDALVGTTGNERLDGGEGDDLFYEWGGTDTLVGGTGTDTAIYAGTRAGYRVGVLGDTILVQDTNGTATLTEIEALRFADTGSITLEDLRAAATTESLVTLLTNGTPGFLLPTAYTGPLALAYEFTGTDGTDVLSGTARNDFVYLGTGDDAADMGAGDDIADGGTGSNFLTGGEGRDVFFIDGRSLLPVWSCITDFVPGEEVALWGWQPGTSTGTWGEDGGVPGYLGATFYADIDGNGLVETAITLSGRTVAQAPTATASDGLLWFR